MYRSLLGNAAGRDAAVAGPTSRFCVIAVLHQRSSRTCAALARRQVTAIAPVLRVGRARCTWVRLHAHVARLFIVNGYSGPTRPQYIKQQT